MNWIAFLVASLVPLVVGAIYYNPKVLGNYWMKVADMSEEKIKSGNMPIIFLLSFVFSFFLSVSINFAVNHQFHVQSLLIEEPGLMDASTELGAWFKEFIENYGNNYRTFGHGALHGVLQAITFALPLIAINALFERKSWGYIFVHFGYWLISIAIMGGIICAWQ